MVKQVTGVRLPCATIILPCRGVEDGLEENIRMVLEQDYPDFEVLLVTTVDDASLPILLRLAHEFSAHARVVLSEREHKVTKQLAALSEMSVNSEVLVFVDSDGRIRSDFLRAMVETLAEPRVGLATGWRWYIPDNGGYWSYVRSAWNAGTLPFLVDNRYNIAFGGAMAVRREIFDRLDMASQWQNALSDGLSLARAVKGIGYKVKFTPRCIAVSREGGTAGDILEWTNRQATISRVYMPEFWRVTAIAHTVSILVLFITMLAGTLEYGVYGILAALGVYFGLLEVNVLITISVVVKILKGKDREDFKSVWWRYLCAAPVAAWLYGVNVLRSSLSRRITWRGITYVMESATETRIVKRSHR